MCAHMMLVVASQRRELFEATNRRELVRTYFHPAYLVENCIQAVGQHLEAPQAHFGPLGNSVDDIVALDSDGEEVDFTPAMPQNPMLPPVKYTLDQYKLNARRGRRRTRRYRSSGSATASDGATARTPTRVGVDELTAEDQARQFLDNPDLDFDL